MTDIGFNTKINMFKDNLVTIIGNSQLPIGITYYILKDVLLNIENLYKETLEKEKQDLLSTMEKEKQEVDKDKKEE